MKSLSTTITDANGGLNCARSYRKAITMLQTHPYAIGRLFHIVMTGSEDRAVYRKATKQLCAYLREHGMPCMYKACYERDEKKRFHKHIFLLVEAKHTHPRSVLHYRKGDFFTDMMLSLGLGFEVVKPSDPMHNVAGRPSSSVYVAKKGPMLEDAILWISYLFKNRSKEGVEGQLYTSSTNRGSEKVRQPKQQPVPAQPQQPQAVRLEQPAPPTNNNQKADDDMNLTTLTPAGLQYMAGLYEHCVDADMDVGAIYAYLTRKGVSVTRAEVIHHLDHVFKFDGYAATHPAKPIITYAQADAEMRKPARRASQLAELR